MLQLNAQTFSTQHFQKQLVYLCRKYRKWVSKGVWAVLCTEVIMSKQRIFFPKKIIFQFSCSCRGQLWLLRRQNETEKERKQRAQELDLKQRCVWQLQYVPHEELASISYRECLTAILKTCSPHFSLRNLLKCSPPLLINVSSIASICLCAAHNPPELQNYRPSLHFLSWKTFKTAFFFLREFGLHDAGPQSSVKRRVKCQTSNALSAAST